MDLPTEHANACGNHWEQKTTNKFVPTCGADKHESNFNCTPKVAPSKKLLELRTPYILIDLSIREFFMTHMSSRKKRCGPLRADVSFHGRPARNKEKRAARARGEL